MNGPTVIKVASKFPGTSASARPASISRLGRCELSLSSIMFSVRYAPPSLAAPAAFCSPPTGQLRDPVIRQADGLTLHGDERGQRVTRGREAHAHSRSGARRHY